MASDAVDGRRTDESLRIASAGSLIILQIFSRFLTLFMTQMQVRLTSAEVLGAANIHFEIMLGLILALSREGFRTALSRSASGGSSSGSSSSSNNNYTSATNVALLPVPIGICIAIVVMTVYTSHLAPFQLIQHPHFTSATWTFLAGAVLELLAEPLYIDSLMTLDTITRVMAEGLAVAAKSASTLLSLWYIQSTTSLLPFGIGQMFFGATFLVVFWISTARRRGLPWALRYLMPSRGSTPAAKGTSQEGGVMFDKQSLQLSWTMTRQNIVKHALGEGDKFAVARLTSLSDQGAYALASNYGSLVARLLYQPLEESSRLTFARALGSNDSPSLASLQLAAGLLQHLLSFHILLSLFLITFCPPFSSTLLLILAGRRWAFETSAPSILSVYGSIYLPAMAFNGLLEGFLQACAPPSQLTRYALVLVAASGLFIFNLVAFHYIDVISAERGLILASSLSTMARAAYSYRFTSSYFQARQKKQSNKARASSAVTSQLSLSSLLPHPITIATFVISAITVRWSPYMMKTTSKAEFPTTHMVIGLTCASMCAGTCLIFERTTLLGALRAIRGKRE